MQGKREKERKKNERERIFKSKEGKYGNEVE